MKTLLRKDDLRLATITLYRAEIILLILGLVKSVYDMLGHEIEWERILLDVPGMTLVNILAVIILIIGLKKINFAVLGVGYFLYTAATVVDFFIVNSAVEGQLYEENDMSLAALVSAAILTVFFITVVVLTVRQSKAAGGITDRDRKIWILPGILYLVGYFSFYVCVFGRFMGEDGLQDIILSVLIFTFISMILVKLLEIVALFSCMKWMTCPESTETKEEKGAEQV